MVHGLEGLKFGLAINLRNPITGKIVHFDECDRRAGTMIESKGPGLAQVLGFAPGRRSLEKQWLAQSLSQVQSAGRRRIVWYFAERYAAGEARKVFVRYKMGRQHIGIRVVPAVMK